MTTAAPPVPVRPARVIPRAGAAAAPLRVVARVLARLVGAATIAFLAVNLLTDDPVRTTLGLQPVTPELIAEVHADLGLDDPLPVRWANYVAGAFRGDLGTSYQQQAPVTQVVGDQLWPTVQLALAAFALAIAAALLVALATTGGRRRRLRAAVDGAELLVLSVPSFWLGILLLTVFSFGLGWFPVIGDASTGWRGLVLPAVTLAVPVAAVLSQVLRDGLDQALAQPFATSARARGLTGWQVRRRHALRHALLPVVTLSGWTVGSLLGGAVVVETVFGRPGLGRVAATAISQADVPTVSGVVLVSAAMFVVANGLVELLYPVLDPRLKGTRR